MLINCKVHLYHDQNLRRARLDLIRPGRSLIQVCERFEEFVYRWLPNGFQATRESFAPYLKLRVSQSKAMEAAQRGTRLRNCVRSEAGKARCG